MVVEQMRRWQDKGASHVSALVTLPARDGHRHIPAIPPADLQFSAQAFSVPSREIKHFAHWISRAQLCPDVDLDYPGD